MAQPAVEALAMTVGAVVSVLGATVSAVVSYRLTTRARHEAAEELTTRFREPLLQTAHNLQGRIYNINRLSFLEKFLTNPQATEAERQYAVRNTVYLVGQFLGWVEIVRRESQFSDPRRRAHNRAIAHQLEKVRDVLSDSFTWDDPTFRLFRGDQRAIGEVMLTADSDAPAGCPRWRCIGYSDYIAQHDPEFVRWFTPIEGDVELLGKDPARRRDRLVAVQHSLLDLMDVLDPDGDRVSLALRQRL